MICKPCHAVSGGFRDPPADYVTELSAKKADGRDKLVNTSVPPRALPNKDRDMLVAFPSPILASSSSSFYAFSCQKPKIQSTSTSQMVNSYFIRDTPLQPPTQPENCKQGSYSTSLRARSDCSQPVDTLCLQLNKGHKACYMQCILMYDPQRKKVLIIQSASSFVFVSTGCRINKFLALLCLAVPYRENEKSFSRQNKNMHQQMQPQYQKVYQLTQETIQKEKFLLLSMASLSQCSISDTLNPRIFSRTEQNSDKIATE